MNHLCEHETTGYMHRTPCGRPATFRVKLINPIGQGRFVDGFYCSRHVGHLRRLGHWVIEKLSN
jgi:hypothetical protein